MNPGKDGVLRRLKWYIVIVGVALAASVAFMAFAGPEASWQLQLVWFTVELVLWAAVILMLAKALKKFDTLSENSTKLDKIAATLEKNHSVLAQINQSARLSETAKAIVFRDANKQFLQEAVFDKLQQQDFDTTYEIIDEITHFAGYQELAEQLRTQADKYRDATDQERTNQIVAHIEKLLEDYQWAKASVLIERLIKANPQSEKARALRQKLLDKKQQRKKVLLNAWDEAVKREDTDRSLEILRELDLYLSPNEGLALQEAARDVFRNKLHNLGVQFSLAVSEKQWAKAVQTGQQIIRDFPNSKMAEEIRENLDILKQKARQQAG